MRHSFSIPVLLAVSLTLTACGGSRGGGGGGGGADYDYGVSLNPDKTMVAPGGTVNLNLHYDAPAHNAGVTWKLICLQTDCGSISASGVFTAPAKVDQQVVVAITATSNDNPAKGYYVEIWVSGKIVVRINANNLVGLPVNQTAPFTAWVNSPDTAVIWQVNGVTGGNSTVGTISTAGLYTAPAQVPSPDTVTIGAVAHVDSSASSTAAIQIWPALQVVVSITPDDRSVPVGTTLQFSATVQNSTDTAVQWQVNGIQGGNATVGTISAAGLFTAPAVVPSPAQETITAVSHADSSKSASTSVTIVALHNELLSGSYGFELSGPDATGKMSAIIGSLIADGNGNLHGLLDMNGVALAGAQKSVQFTGTYRIGAQNMGLIFLDLTPQLTLSFAVNSTGNNARLVEYDTRGTRYVGSLQRQDTPLSLDAFSGYYVFSSYGSTMSGERMTVMGRLQTTGGLGTVLDGIVYTKERGESMTTVSGLTGTAALSNNTYGRGDFTFTKSGTILTHFSFYMLNGNEGLMLSTGTVPSDNPLLIGRIFKQAAGPFTTGSLSGKSIFYLSGERTTDSTQSIAIVGRWNAFPNSDGFSVTSYDVNEGGQISTSQSFGTTYSIDVTGYGGVVASGFPYGGFAFYVIDRNRAILMQGGEEGLIGMAEPDQTTTFDNSIFNGTYRIGPVSMPKPDGSISQGILVADGSGTFWAGENILDQGLSTQTFNGNYSVDSTGRTQVTFTAPETFHYVAYPASPSRFIGISIEPYDSKPNVVTLDQ